MKFIRIYVCVCVCEQCPRADVHTAMYTRWRRLWRWNGAKRPALRERGPCPAATRRDGVVDRSLAHKRATLVSLVLSLKRVAVN